MFGGLDDEYGDGEEMTQIQATQLQESSDEEDGVQVDDTAAVRRSKRASSRSAYDEDIDNEIVSTIFADTPQKSAANKKEHAKESRPDTAVPTGRPAISSSEAPSPSADSAIVFVQPKPIPQPPSGMSLQLSPGSQQQEQGSQAVRSNGESNSQVGAEDARDLSLQLSMGSQSQSQGRASQKGPSENAPAISQISQLDIDLEAEAQVAEVAVCAVRQEARGHVAPASVYSLESSQQLVENFSKAGFSREFFLKVRAFRALKHAAKCSGQSSERAEEDDGCDETQPKMSLQLSMSESESMSQRGYDGAVNLASVGTDGMVSLSFESSMESQSQMKADDAASQSQSSRIGVPAATAPSQSQPGVAAHGDGVHVIDETPPNATVIEETPPTTTEASALVPKATILPAESGEWISTTDSSRFKKRKPRGSRGRQGELHPPAPLLDRKINEDDFEGGDEDDVSGSGANESLGSQHRFSSSQALVGRSKILEKAVLKSIKRLLPEARRIDIGIRTFYYRVKEDIGNNLDDSQWLPFVWDSVINMMDIETVGSSAMQMSQDQDWDQAGDQLLSQVASQALGVSQQDVVDRDQAAGASEHSHEDWSLAKHRTSRSAKKKGKSGTQKKKASKKGRRKAATAPQSVGVWKLAKQIRDQDLPEVQLQNDDVWRALWHKLNKERGWTWKYGSGVIAQKYYAPGYGDMKKKEEKEWLGKRVFYNILAVVRFVLLTEEDTGASDSEHSTGSSDDEENDAGENESASLHSKKSDGEGAEQGEESASDDSSETEELFASLLEDAAMSLGGDKNKDPKNWKTIFGVLQGRGWVYKAAPKHLQLLTSWVYVEPKDGGEEIVHNGSHDAIRSLCLANGIAIPESDPVGVGKRRRRPVSRLSDDSPICPKRLKRLEAEKKAKKDGKRGLDETSSVGDSDRNAKRRKEGRGASAGNENLIEELADGLLNAGSGESEDSDGEGLSEFDAMLQQAASHDSAFTDPPNWSYIFAKLKLDGWCWVQSSSSLRAWDYKRPPSAEDREPTMYTDPRAIARALCNEKGISFDGPTESQEADRSSRARRAPKRFEIKRTPPKKKKTVAEKVDQTEEEPALASVDESVLVQSPSAEPEAVVPQKRKTRKKPKLFTGFHFILSGLGNPQRKEVQDLLKQNGGKVHRDISRFENAMKECENTPDDEAEDMKGFFILSTCEPTAYRRAKYLYSLAVDVPTIHYSWVEKCVEGKQMESVLPSYILPRGLSLKQGKYVFPEIADMEGDDMDGDMVLVSPKAPRRSSTAVSTARPAVYKGAFHGLTIGLVGTNLGHGSSAEHSDWWHILNMAGATVFEGSLNSVKRRPVDYFVCRMDDFGILPELRKVGKRRQTPIVNFEWCIQCLVEKERIPHDAFSTFGTGHAGGGITSGRAKKNVAWGSSNVASEYDMDKKMFTAVKVSGERYCLGEMIYVQNPMDPAEQRYGVLKRLYELKDSKERRAVWRYFVKKEEKLVDTGEFIDSPVDSLVGKFMVFSTSWDLVYLKDAAGEARYVYRFE